MKLSRKRPRKIDGPSHRIIKPNRTRTPRYRARRMFVIGIIVITCMFLAKIFIGLFDFEHVEVSIALLGNSHYTEGQIYDVLGKNLENIITDSEAKTVAFLKENLSYIKDAHVNKNLVKRQLTIDITERKPFARVNYILSKKQKKQKTVQSNTANRNKNAFFLIDEAGYVLEYITSDKHTQMVLILDEGTQEPEIGKQIKTDTTQLGIRSMKLIWSRAPTIAKGLKTIDARISQKIKIYTQSIPIPVWIAADMMETGLHHVELFVNQQGLLIMQREISNSNTMTKNLTANKDIHLPQKYTYLDARYEDTLYLGGSNK